MGRRLPALALCGSILATGAAAGAVLPAGTDLGTASRQAADGAVLELGAGRYPGQIYVEGRRLTIRGAADGGTVLDGEVQILAAVLGGGRLRLENVTFRPRGADGLAVYVVGGVAEVTDCRVPAATQPAMFVKAGRLVVERCRFEGTTSDAIRGSEGAEITVTDSVFRELGGIGLALLGGSRAWLRNSSFADFGRPAIFLVGGSEVTLEGGRLSATGDGIVLQQQSRAVVRGTAFDGIDGMAVAALEGSRAVLRGARFEGLAGIAVYGKDGSLLEIGETGFLGIGREAVFADGVTSLEVRDSRFRDIASAAVFAQGGTGSLRVEGSRFSDTAMAVAAVEPLGEVVVRNNRIAGSEAERAAISLASPGRAIVSGNRILAPFDGIVLTEPRELPAVVADNLVVGARGVAIYLQSDSPASAGSIRLFGNRVIGSGQVAIEIAGRTPARIRDNLVLADGTAAIYLRGGAAGELAGNTVAGGDVALYLDRESGATARIDDDLLLAERADVYPGEGWERSAAGEVLAGRLEAGEVRARLSTLAVAVKAAAREADIEGLEAIETATAPLLAEASALRGEVGAIATLTLEVVDATGRSLFAPFTLLDAEENEIATVGPEEGVAAVDAGRYLVEPAFDPLLAREVTLAAGEERVVRIEAPEHVALTLEWYDPEAQGFRQRLLFVRLKDEAGMARARAAPPPRGWALRPGVSAARIAAARRLALERLEPAIAMHEKAVADYNEAIDRVLLAPGPGVPERLEQLRIESARGESPWRWIRRILFLSGTREDAARLVALAGREAYAGYAEELIELAAGIENRLGMLEEGAVAGLLEEGEGTPALTAARLLHAYGSRAGDALLLARLARPDDDRLVPELVTTLGDSADAAVLEAMRGVLRAALAARQRAEAQQAGAPGPPAYPYYLNEAGWRSALHLLAFGGPADRALAADYPLPETAQFPLARLLVDPWPVIALRLEVMADQQASFTIDWARFFCPSLELLPETEAEEIHRRFRDGLVSIAVAQNWNGLLPRAIGVAVPWMYGVASGRCRASAELAEIVYQARFKAPQAESYVGKEDWIARDWKAQELIAAFADGNPLLDAQLEHLAPETVAAGLAGREGPPGTDLFLAWHAIGSGGCGPDRCPFVLTGRSGAIGGALAVVLRPRPSFAADALTVELDFDLAAKSDGGLAEMIANPEGVFAPYLRSRGAALVERVFATRGGEQIPLEKVEGAEGIVYRASMENPVPDDLYLHIVLRLFDRQRTLDLPLFATSAAKRLRLAAVGDGERDR